LASYFAKDILEKYNLKYLLFTKAYEEEELIDKIHQIITKFKRPFIIKPDGGSGGAGVIPISPEEDPSTIKNLIEESKKEIKKTMFSMLKAFSHRQEIKSILKVGAPVSEKRKETGSRGFSGNVVRRMQSIIDKKRAKAEIIGIGISTGGPQALSQMMPQIPPDINVPILIVQHMPPIFTKSLANNLDSKCKIDVREAVDGETVQPNMALIAPGGKQMKVVAGADGKNRIIRVTDDPPEKSCKPSVDYLFRSLAQHYIGRSTGVIMTGMGSDGTLGLKLMKRAGSTIIAQDESTCVVYGMPKEPIEEGIADIIAPLNKIAEEIVSCVM
jgi:two-component system chemotaxis response regulator CheB